MKFNYSFVFRALIALLFVVAGVQKIIGFTGSVGFISSLGVPLPVIATILVIIIEVPVALMFVFYPKKLCLSGMILAGFTLLTIVLVHNPFTATDEAFKVTLTAALKNLAIVGGILAATVMCTCGKCPMGKEGKKCEKCA